MTKICKQCKVEKPLEDYYRDNRMLDGRRKGCKTCKDKKVLAWRESNKSRYNEIARIHNQKRYPVSRLQRYNLTHEQYLELLEKQNHSCAICGKSNTSEKRELPIDHDHLTGEVRGILCYSCNRHMALIDDPIQLARCIAYKNKKAA